MNPSSSTAENRRPRQARVALATASKVPGLAPEERGLLPALGAEGILAEPLVWDDSAVRWTDFDTVIIRSTWDYHLKPAEFRCWIDGLERAGTPLLNPASILRWNSDKRYLADLEGRGVPTVPTEWVEPGHDASLIDILHRRGWQDAVVKPAVSANAHQTWRTAVDLAEHDEEAFREMVSTGTVMVQQYLREIETEGEWSLLFFGGDFSHAVRKRPRSGDFRVQDDHGGTVESAAPTPALLGQAQRVVDAVAEPWLYARVDGCVVDHEFLLMELEMIEPSLYLGYEREAAARFARAAARMIVP